MEKLAYLLRSNSNEPGSKKFAATHSSLLSTLPVVMVEHGAWDIVINIADLTDEVRQRNPARVVGNMESVIAAVEFWLDCYNQREGIEQLLSELCDELHGYLVTESVVQPNNRQWQDGERRPGVTQLCLFDKGASCPEDNFYALWHETLSPWSADLHPLRCGYVRNSVTRPLTQQAEQYRGIVKEYWPALNDWVDDERYADPAVAEEFFPKVGDLTNMDTMILGPTSEYCFSTRK